VKAHLPFVTRSSYSLKTLMELAMTLKTTSNFSVVVPTYREVKNLRALVERISQMDFGDCQFELIIVDDNSQDGTEALVASLQQSYPWLKLIKRRAPKSLSASALEGFHQALYPIVILMDADLSHPPEKILAMLSALQSGQVDFVIGSRYVQGGTADEIWPVTRKLTSRLSAFLARILISAKVKDPLSGFFAVRKTTLASGDPLEPIGWKLGLEIMLKCRCQHIQEIPIHFSERLQGKSKLNLKVALDYLRHLNRLLWYKLSR
jgi:dolichol-phosphate mannosyltransferase